MPKPSSIKGSSFTAPGQRVKELQESFVDDALREVARNLVDEIIDETDNFDKYLTLYLMKNKDRIRDAIDISSDYRIYLETTTKKVNEVLDEFANKIKKDITLFQNKAFEVVNIRLKEIEKEYTRKLEIKLPKKKKIEVENVHVMFEDLLLHSSDRDTVLMSGPAGSGKGTASEQVADILKLPYYSKSCSIQDNISHWFGYMDGNGVYHPSLFRQAWEHGGVFLIDEFDQSNPLVSTSLNAALAGTQTGFPDKMVKRHEDCIIMAAGNTWGLGGSSKYIGANQLNPATLDRFSFLTWDYDEGLEMKIAPVQTWTRLVQDVRKAMFKKDLQYVVSPRTSIAGGRLLKIGLSLDKVIDRRLFKGWDKDSIEIVKRASNFERNYKILQGEMGDGSVAD